MDEMRLLLMKNSGGERMHCPHRECILTPTDFDSDTEKQNLLKVKNRWNQSSIPYEKKIVCAEMITYEKTRNKKISIYPDTPNRVRNSIRL